MRAALLAGMVILVPGSVLAVDDLLDLPATGTVLELFRSEYNGSSAATRLFDGDPTTTWRSNWSATGEYFVFSFAGGAPAATSSLSLYNYNSSRGVKHFRLFVSDDPAAAADAGHSSWTLVTLPTGSDDPANLVGVPYGGTLHAFRSEYNTSSGASRALDGNLDTTWRSNWSATQEYLIVATEDEEAQAASRLVMHNYNSSRGVKDVRVYVSSDPDARTDATHLSWTPVAISSGSTAEVNLVGIPYGGSLEAFRSEYNTSSGASRALDGNLQTTWRSNWSATNEYFIAGTEDLLSQTTDRLVIHNYNSSRGAQDVRLFVSSDAAAATDPEHSSWSTVNVTSGTSTEAVNLVGTPYGGELHDYRSQYGTSSAASRALDGNKDTTWRSNWSASDEYFIVSTENAQSQVADQLVVYNYNSSRGVKDVRLLTSSSGGALNNPDHSSWSPVSISGGSSELVNLVGAPYGAELTDYSSQYGTTSAADRVCDGNQDTAWRSSWTSSGDHFIFRTEDSEEYTFNRLDVVNYNSSRGVQSFRVYTSTVPGASGNDGHASWSEVSGSPFTAAQASGVQTFTFSNRAAKLLKFEVVSNHGDSSTAIKEIMAYGTRTLADAGIFRVDQTSGEQTFDFDSVSAKYFQFRVLNNHGDSTFAMKEWYVTGTTTLEDKDIFRVAQASGEQEFTFDVTSGKYYQLRVLTNYGDSTFALKEWYVTGTTTLEEKDIFRVAQASGEQEFTFDATSGKFFQLEILSNYGDSTFALKEWYVTGTTTLEDKHIFLAEQASTVQPYSYDSATGVYLQIKILTNYGDSTFAAKEFIVPGSLTGGLPFTIENWRER